MTARIVDTWIVVGEPDLEAARECPSCGFDSVLAFPLTLLSGDGVSTFGQIDACVRCCAD